MSKHYNLQNIHTLLIEGFTAEELRRLCYHSFRDVYNQLASNSGKTEIIDKLIEYADQKELIEILLTWSKENNSTKYEKHKPYYENSTITEPTPTKFRDEVSSVTFPIISIGILGVAPLLTIKKIKKLPTIANISQGYPYFQLVIRNAGRLAKFVKIHLEFKSFQDESFLKSALTSMDELAFPVVKIPENNPFKWKNNKDYIFNGGLDWVLYQNDIITFDFFLKTIIVDYPPVPHDYFFGCTVWAEGMTIPVNENLIVRVVRSKS